MDKQNKHNGFPIFTIDGDEILNKHTDIALQLQSTINNSSEKLHEMHIQLDKIGLQLNLFINNITTLSNPFDFKNNVIHFINDNEFCIYSHKEIKKIEKKYITDEEQEKALNTSAKYKYKLNTIQSTRCMDLIEKYNVLWENYNDMYNQFRYYHLQYDNLLTDVKNIISSVKLFEINTDISEENQFEPFNESKHELLITQDKGSNKWKWVYIRKKDRNKIKKN